MGGAQTDPLPTKGSEPEPHVPPLQIRIWGRPEAITEDQGEYALQVTGPILNFFEKHYNTAYPLPKSGACRGTEGWRHRGWWHRGWWYQHWRYPGWLLRCTNRTPLPPDQVGLPDFNAGAMENWGLVTYRENSLLFDDAYSSIGNKERVVTVIAHELAHQVLTMPPLPTLHPHTVPAV